MALKRKHKRLTFVMIALLLLGAATALVLTALEEDIVFFHSPTDVKEKALEDGKRFRLGGLVEDGSVDKTAQPLVKFKITDGNESLAVHFKGLLPDLFREGQGVVTEGRMMAGVFVADEVLAGQGLGERERVGGGGARGGVGAVEHGILPIFAGRCAGAG